MTAVPAQVGRPRTAVIGAVAEVLIAVFLIGLAVWAQVDNPTSDVGWLIGIGVFGLASGIGLFYQYRLARVTSGLFGIVTGLGAMFSVLGTEGSSELIFIPIALVFVGSLLVIVASGWGAVGWMIAILLGGSVDSDDGDSGGSATI